MNHSRGGKRIEQVCEDVSNQHQSIVANASSLIIHVGTNNLKSDSVDEIKYKVQKLADTVKAHTSNACEIALSSIILYIGKTSTILR